MELTMAKELVFIDWDDTLVNRENAEDFESVTDENNTIYQMSPMFIGAVEALKQLQEKYHVVIVSSRGDLNRLRQLQLQSYDLESSIMPLDNFTFEDNDNRLLFTRYGETNFPDKASFILYIQKMSGNKIKVFIDDDHTEIEAAQSKGIPTIHATHKKYLQNTEQFFSGLIHQVDNMELSHIFNKVAAEIRNNSRSLSWGRQIAGFFSVHLPIAQKVENLASKLQRKSAIEVSEEFDQYLKKIAYDPNKKGDIAASLTKAKTAIDKHISALIEIKEVQPFLNRMV
ncbi:Lpg2555 family Dot/Icm T4SS effector hydrolase [Legionella pneumophila serogroup 1]|uniref:Lpg2555 family Dot/Icm T4SS effector hydrolase n=1 Tax=Legionella pneumophila TaxID=446 RepID=UPI0009B234F9|nr:Lpg2555 family Dot/Icm T4SS effector hydrolase [Legionella pneumophila]HAT9273521.1 HAD family hydrolase [Legionella pneumophila subsp. pneumophila]MCO1451853.1 Lpg2555 family Dot/Icm T4SS effector hydrolase [Legionella pneumophila]MCZ4723155.1 Lpg2555 family Dot/Icm T4SS effector hydrolase [Legionella pneumophila]MCZ4729990.1 Lpg2555 family Dot/Icm T4SS effector hydrolase [Legionella pneumophila]MCZ4735084.1 Lpg2555 family Dot/Icm T4SS effector hydrolase [Legionella pneumophila]